MSSSLRFILFALAGLASVAQAAPHLIECPATLELHSNASAPPAGWTAISGETSFRFEGIGIFDGHPAGLASLVPDRDLAQSGDGASGVAEWDFPGGSKGIWIACSYVNTAVSLARPLDEGLGKCSVKGRHESWGWQFDRTITCE